MMDSNAKFWGAVALGGLCFMALARWAFSSIAVNPVSTPSFLRPNITVSVVAPGFSKPAGGLEKYEPKSGVYLGAYLDLDPELKEVFRDENGSPRKVPSEFEARVGRPHAMYFFYLGYGRKAPMDWIGYLTSKNKYVQIALEPNDGLDAVTESSYLLDLADDLRKSGARIFLRFASEMNGDWVNYHGDPEKYKEKWRLVARVMKDRAPNVAMVWCPYAMPIDNVEDYYPGHEWVDWVGVNLYNVTYFNQNKASPAHGVSPRDLLRPIYNKYAAQKPIMICEYATTHYSALENKSVPFFAVNNIKELYGALQTEFPRVKAIYYFSSNNLKLAHRRNNNYSLLHDKLVLEAYRREIRDPYFKSEPAEDGGGADEWYSRPLVNGTTLRGRVTINAYAQAETPVQMVRFSIDGKPFHTGSSNRGWSMVLDARRLTKGERTLTVEAFDSVGNRLVQRSIKFNAEPGSGIGEMIMPERR